MHVCIHACMYVISASTSGVSACFMCSIYIDIYIYIYIYIDANHTYVFVHVVDSIYSVHTQDTQRCAYKQTHCDIVYIHDLQRTHTCNIHTYIYIHTHTDVSAHKHTVQNVQFAENGNHVHKVHIHIHHTHTHTCAFTNLISSHRRAEDFKKHTCIHHTRTYTRIKLCFLCRRFEPTSSRCWRMPFRR